MQQIIEKIKQISFNLVNHRSNKLKGDVENLVYKFNHFSTMACFLIEGISDHDFELLEFNATASSKENFNYVDSGFVIYVTPLEYYDESEFKDFSEDFHQVIQYCQTNKIEWLRFLP